MFGVAVGTLYVGYSLVYYGASQLRGGNWGLLDLTVPSRWTVGVAATPTDTGTTIAGGVLKTPTKSQGVIAKVENGAVDAAKQTLKTFINPVGTGIGLVGNGLRKLKGLIP